LIDEYGNEQLKAHRDEIIPNLRVGDTDFMIEEILPDLDDWHRAKIENKQDFKDLFETRFYYGCEADDPTAAWAFNARVNPMGAKIRAMLSSDIGHCDVPDIRDVLPEAYELVEDGLLNDEEFRDFVFTNAVRLYAGMNPNFFKGTRIEADVDQVLANETL